MIVGYLNNAPQKISIKRPCNGYYLRWWYSGWHYWFFYPGKQSLITEGEKYRTIGTKSVMMGTGQITYEQCQAIRTIMNTREVYILTDDGWKNISISPGSLIVYDNQVNGYEVELTTKIGSREISATGFSPIQPDVLIYDPNVITIITVIDGVFTIVAIGNAGETIVIDWGDGTAPEIVVLTGGEDTITHDYTGSGGDEHTITIDGEENIITLDLSDNDIIAINIPDGATSLTELDLSGNLLTETPIIPDTVPLISLDTTGNPLTICQIQIGSQVWMCKNYDSNYPNSKAYNNDPLNIPVYGKLYSGFSIRSSSFAPSGWRIPTLADWQELIVNCGGNAVAGGVLKEIGFVHWDAPNTGATDKYTFSAVAGGRRNDVGVYNYLKERAIFWVDGTDPDLKAQLYMMMSNISAAISQSSYPFTYYASVRLLRNIPSPIPPVIDADGNIYTYVTVGTQQWLVENLRTTKYADGTPIPNLTLNADWIAEDGTGGHDGAYCYYDNDIANKADFGTLYNWYAVNNAHGLAPTGWRIPNNADFATLVAFLGGDATAGGKLKEIGTTHWTTPNTGAVDSYGFKALPGGYRGNNGIYYQIAFYNNIWSASIAGGSNAWSKIILWNNAGISSSDVSQLVGCSIRCMRDI